MGLVYRLEDYARYEDHVGGATVVDVTRRADPARMAAVWERLRDIVATYGAPWIVQVWTKDVGGLLGHAQDLLWSLIAAGTTVAAQVTVTGLAGTAWEPTAPRNGFEHVDQLTDLLGGTAHVKWRYDPIIPTVHSDSTFRDLAGRAADLGLTQGVINYLAPPGRYKRVDRRLASLLPGWAEGMHGYDDGWRATTARRLVGIAAERGISLACCAEGAQLAEAVDGLGHAACGDHDWFVRLSGRDPGRVTYRGSRPGCGCARYFDLGSYGQWARCHRCAYCYAG